MKSSAKNLILALGMIALGLAIAAAGIYIGETDDAPAPHSWASWRCSARWRLA